MIVVWASHTFKDDIEINRKFEKKKRKESCFPKYDRSRQQWSSRFPGMNGLRKKSAKKNKQINRCHLNIVTIYFFTVIVF